MAVTRYLKIDSKTGRRKEESERELGKKTETDMERIDANGRVHEIAMN